MGDGKVAEFIAKTNYQNLKFFQIRKDEESWQAEI